MDRLFKGDPVTTIELIAALGIIIGGLYILSPFLEISVVLSQAPRAVQALASTLGLVILGSSLLITGVANIVGILRFNFKLRASAIFVQMLLRMYIIAAIILSQGFFPLDWLNNFITLCILFVCYVAVRRKGYILGVFR
jgi:hypothetical protein